MEDAVIFDPAEIVSEDAEFFDLTCSEAKGELQDARTHVASVCP